MDSSLLNFIMLVALVFVLVLTVILIISVSSFIKLTKNINSSLEILTSEVSHSLSNITKDVNSLKEKLVESLENMDNMAGQLSQSVQTIEKEANEVLNIFTPFKALINVAYSRIAPPVNRFSLMFSASTKAINAFIDGLAGKK